MTTALQHLAKKAKISINQAELYWAKAGNIVKKEYDVDEKDGKFWPLRMSITKKMMGLSEAISFKEFIGEAAVAMEPKYEALEVKHAIDLLNRKCKNSLWMLHENHPIYRGEKDNKARSIINNHGFAVVDTSATMRRSANTSNWYTKIFDNHPLRQHFPKRSRSFICTTDKKYADTYMYGTNANSFIIIPTDTAKIGLVNDDDMWDTVIKLFGRERDIASINIDLDELFKYQPAAYATLVEFDELMDNKHPQAISLFERNFGASAKSIKKGFLADILDAYSEESTGHSSVTSDNLPHDYHGELWVGGRVVVISPGMWEKLRSAI